MKKLAALLALSLVAACAADDATKARDAYDSLSAAVVKWCTVQPEQWPCNDPAALAGLAKAGVAIGLIPVK